MLILRILGQDDDDDELCWADISAEHPFPLYSYCTGSYYSLALLGDVGYNFCVHGWDSTILS